MAGRKIASAIRQRLLFGYIIKRINKNDQCGDPSEANWFLAGPVVVERITIIMCPSTTLGVLIEVVRLAGCPGVITWYAK